MTRALVLTAGLIFLVISIFLGRMYWSQLILEKTASTADTTSPLNQLRFWKAEDIKRRIDTGEKIVFLDIRPYIEYETEHIIDAVFFSPDAMQSFLPEPGTVYVIVASRENQDSTFWQNLINFFEKKKMQSVLLEGGIESWRMIGGRIISRGNPESFIDQSKVVYVTPEQALELIQSAAVLPLDVRSGQEYRSGHIPEALHLPLNDLEARRETIKRSKPLLVYGADELAGFQAGVRLFDMGFFGSRVLEGGYAAWQKNGYPITQEK